MGSGSRIAIIVAILAAAVGAFLWFGRKSAPPPPAASAPGSIAPVTPPPIPAPAPAKPDSSAILHPLGPTQSPARDALPDLDESDTYFKNALGELLGRKTVLSALVVDGFARRVVATVNNLASDNAAAGMWPVNRTAGSFDTEERAEGRMIGAKNAERYAAFVRFVAGIDTDRAVALYKRVYPLLQRGYEDLGFPGKYFNDRVVEVIDHLLATPDVAQPIKVKPVEVAGAPKPPGAAALYVFEDPTLEVSSSGQKILLRMGRDNAAKLKAKLAEIRQRIAQGPGPAPYQNPGSRDAR